MIRKTSNVRALYCGWADALSYVFLQMDAKGLGRQATGYEYVPRRQQMTTQERREVRKALRQALRDSVAML